MPIADNNLITETDLTGGVPEASINVENFPLDDRLGKWETPDGGPYADYKVRNRYEKDRHRYALGITSPNGFQNQSVAVVQLASPTLLLVSEWTVCRATSKPKIPDPESVDSRWVLLDDHYAPFMLGLAPDGESAIYRISGVYVYACLNPSALTAQDLAYPRAPWMQDVFDRSVQPGELQAGLIMTGVQLPTAIVSP